MHSNCTLNVISIASTPAPKLDVYAIQSDNKILHVYDAHLIRLLSDLFQVPYRVILADEWGFGIELPDGNWSGITGMLRRSEVDLSVGGTSLNEDMIYPVNFSYPHLFSDFTFMTDKLKPVSRNLALLNPFHAILWVALIAAIIFFSFLIFFLTNKSRPYPYILLMTYGTVLEKPIQIELQKTSHTLLIGAWLFFSFVITNCYKALFLSFLVLPNFTGIRDISDLAQAGERNLVTCYSYNNNVSSELFLQSSIDSWKSIGKCLQRNPIMGGTDELFVKAPPGKALIAARVYLKPYKEKYLISENSFFATMSAIMISRNFCNTSYLNKRIHRLIAAGVFDKLYRYEELQLEIKSSLSDSNQPDDIKELQINDLKGAFLVLIFGYILASVVFFTEITVNYYCRDKRQF